MNGVTITHIGGPTVLLSFDGWNILTDPTFDAPGRRYDFGLGAYSFKTDGPALEAAALPRIDAVLLTHDHHADNLDDAGRKLLETVPVVVTTASGKTRLSASNVVGLNAWERTQIVSGGKHPLDIQATPCRHGPPLSRRITGDVIGFAIRREHESSAAVWISGDSVYYRGIRQVAERINVDIAILHLGAVRFRSTGPLRYTMTARQGAKLLGQLQPAVAVPVHTGGWSHFTEDASTAKRVFDALPRDAMSKILWLSPGEPTFVPARQVATPSR